VNAAYTLFVLGLITTVIVWARSYAESENGTAIFQAARGPRLARSGAMAILGLSLILTGNTRDGIVALSKHIPQNWNRMIHWRDHLIRQQVQCGATELDLPSRDLAAANLANWPRLYLFYDITDDPKWCVNTHLARYYGLRTIRRVPRSASVALKSLRESTDQARRR
jgi:hypothetical protein